MRRKAAEQSVPSRGDAVWLDFEIRVGHEQAGRRPWVVLSPGAYNKRSGLAVLCPVTSRAKGYPFEVGIPQGAQISGVALCDQLQSVEWRGRRAKAITRFPAETVDEILAAARTLLD